MKKVEDKKIKIAYKKADKAIQELFGYIKQSDEKKSKRIYK